jgi:hypothetical protein
LFWMVYECAPQIVDAADIRSIHVGQIGLLMLGTSSQYVRRKNCDTPSISCLPKVFLFSLHSEKGDQIWRMFAYNVMVHFGHFVVKYRCCPSIRTIFFGKSLRINFDKKCSRLQFGRLFRNLIWSPWLRPLLCVQRELNTK